jgi:hypothetical protein
MSLLDKIKNDYKKNSKAITAESIAQQLPLSFDTETEEDDACLFPFNSMEEIKAKATELKTFFDALELPEEKMIFGKGTPVGNPKKFIATALQLIEIHWSNRSFVKDMVCDLVFLQHCFILKKFK